MNYILAISGGVDSVVLLDMVVTGKLSLLSSATNINTNGDNRKSSSASPKLVVAHFEHGIRGKDSEADARFVEQLSQKYRLEFEIGYGNLTKTASEDTARQARYEFLRKLARKHNAQIITAHHQDDLLETIAINFIRGTGWRGLAVMDNDILRPLMTLTKAQIYHYALKHQLEYVEDETNRDTRYLRNQVRSSMHLLTEVDRDQLLQLRIKQLAVRRAIESEVLRFLPRNDRYFFIMINQTVAMEILRAKTKSLLTRPQLQDLLLFLKTAFQGKKWQASNVEMHVDRVDFRLVFPREN